MNRNPKTAQKPPRQGSGFHFYYRVAMRTTFQPLAAVQKPGRQRRAVFPHTRQAKEHSPPSAAPQAGRNAPRSSPNTAQKPPSARERLSFFITGWRCVLPSSCWLTSRSPDGSGEESGIPVHPAGQGVQPVVCRSAGRKEHSHSNPNTAQKPPRQGSGFHFYYRVAMRTTFQPLAVFRKSRR